MLWCLFFGFALWGVSLSCPVFSYIFGVVCLFLPCLSVFVLVLCFCIYQVSVPFVRFLPVMRTLCPHHLFLRSWVSYWWYKGVVLYRLFVLSCLYEFCLSLFVVDRVVCCIFFAVLFTWNDRSGVGFVTIWCAFVFVWVFGKLRGMFTLCFCLYICCYLCCEHDLLYFIALFILLWKGCVLLPLHACLFWFFLICRHFVLRCYFSFISVICRFCFCFCFFVVRCPYLLGYYLACLCFPFICEICRRFVRMVCLFLFALICFHFRFSVVGFSYFVTVFPFVETINSGSFSCCLSSCLLFVFRVIALLLLRVLTVLSPFELLCFGLSVFLELSCRIASLSLFILSCIAIVFVCSCPFFVWFLLFGFALARSDISLCFFRLFLFVRICACAVQRLWKPPFQSGLALFGYLLCLFSVFLMVFWYFLVPLSVFLSLFGENLILLSSCFAVVRIWTYGVRIFPFFVFVCPVLNGYFLLLLPVFLLLFGYFLVLLSVFLALSPVRLCRDHRDWNRSDFFLFAVVCFVFLVCLFCLLNTDGERHVLCPVCRNLCCAGFVRAPFAVSVSPVTLFLMKIDHLASNGFSFGKACLFVPCLFSYNVIWLSFVRVLHFRLEGFAVSCWCAVVRVIFGCCHLCVVLGFLFLYFLPCVTQLLKGACLSTLSGFVTRVFALVAFGWLRFRLFLALQVWLFCWKASWFRLPFSLLPAFVFIM